MRTSRFLMLPVLATIALGCTKGRVSPTQVPMTDVVLLVDHSGSMEGYLDTMYDALEKIAVGHTENEGYLYGVVDITDKDAFNHVSVRMTLTGLERSALVVHALKLLEGADDEPSYAAVYMTAIGAFGGQLSFRPGARRVFVVLGDEHGSSPLFPDINEKAVCRVVDASHAELYVFTDPHNFTDWDWCARTFALSGDSTAMAKSLKEALTPAVVIKTASLTDSERGTETFPLTTDREEVLKMLDNLTKD